ncbi:MAG TPA: hypothetical protein VKE24_05605 [Candidatus Acidoferrales bacterium]|nr:hypothetical protein [Candidatus Acidoferrales bacterium]
MSFFSSWRKSALAALMFLCAVAAPMGAAPEEGPAEALSGALVAACRQNAEEFARVLTPDNAAIFRELPAHQRVRLMERFTLLDHEGRPLLSLDAGGHTVVRCTTPSATTETRFGETRLRENLAFIPVEVRVPGETAGAETRATSRRVEFGLVRQAGGWKLLSVGLLLLNLAELSKQWEASDLEAHESEAIAALRQTAQAIATYRRAFGSLPESLAQLGPASKEGISPDAAGLIDADLTAGKKNGYIFRYRVVPSQGEAAQPGFEISATPAEYGETGRRSFLLDGSGTLRGADKQGAPATASDPRLEPH